MLTTVSAAENAASPEAILLSGAPLSSALRAALTAARAASAETIPVPAEERTPVSTVRAASPFSPWLRPTIAELRAARKIHGKEIEAYFVKVGLALWSEAHSSWQLTEKGQWAFSCARFRPGEGYCQQSRTVRGEFWDLERLGMVKKQRKVRGRYLRYQLTAKGARLARLVLGAAK